MKIFLDANICLDLLDTTRTQAQKTVQWYAKHHDNAATTFYFSGDFITTLFYHLTQKRKIKSAHVIHALNALCEEIEPLYLVHSDFQRAQMSFFEEGALSDLEDLMVLHSAIRLGCDRFITHDKELLALVTFKQMPIVQPN